MGSERKGIIVLDLGVTFLEGYLLNANIGRMSHV